MSWSEVTQRVVIEAADAHPQDCILELGCGEGEVTLSLAHRVREVVAVDIDPAALARLAAKAPGNVRTLQRKIEDIEQYFPASTSVVVLHDVFRFLSPPEQQRLVQRLGGLLPARGVLVIGDIFWSMPFAEIDEPEQFGTPLGNPLTTKELEKLVRTHGFLPDLHRFGPGRAVMIALKS